MDVGDNLLVVKKGGSSIIERRPVFSEDEKVLFLSWGNVVRSYNIHTCELLRDYSGLSDNIVGVSLDPNNCEKLIAISSSGEFAFWLWRTETEPHHQFNLQIANGFDVLQFTIIPSLYADSCVVVAAVGYQKRTFNVKLFCGEKGVLTEDFKNLSVNDNCHSLAARVHRGHALIAGIYNKCLHVVSHFQNRNYEQRKLYCQSRLTCVACHPLEQCIIAGDIIGRVHLWRNVMNEAVTSVYHWHTLPVEDLIFTLEGTSFYSAGGECVLVKWPINAPSKRRFLPRLPAELKHLAISSRCTLIAVSTADNGIQIVNVQFNKVGTIQHISWAKRLKNRTFEIVSDPRTKAIVMNGHVGHLQFFSLHQKRLLFLLNVTSRNYLTQERLKDIQNTEVVKLAFNTNGSWLATIECWEKGDTSCELRMKFWLFDDVKQEYTLNTSIEYPHKSKVNAIAFHPSLDPRNQMCVTTGDDMKFRTWCLVESTNIYKKGYIWHSECVGFYRNLPVGALSFSSDGSLLAVACGSILTVWVPETNNLKSSLTNPENQELLSHVEFGRYQSHHLVVTGCNLGIAVWNLLSLSLIWTVPLNLTLLVSDPLSHHMAAFTTDNDVIVFSPSSSEPIYIKRTLTKDDSDIISAAFIPHAQHEENNKILWQIQSQLFFLNSKQELLCLEHPQQKDKEMQTNQLDSIPSSAFQPKTSTTYAALLAQHVHSDVTSASKKEKFTQLGVPGYQDLKEFLQTPSHTMPHLSLLCRQLLLSFVTNAQDRDKSDVDSECDSEVEHGDSDDSDVDVKFETLEDRKQKLQVQGEKITSMYNPKLESDLSAILTASRDWVHDFR